MATHSSTLARKIPQAEKPVGYSPWGRKESTEQLNSNCGPAQRQPLSVTVWMPCAHIIITHHKLLSLKYTAIIHQTKGIMAEK